MTARLNPAHNPRRFPPCLPSSPSERPSPSSSSSASESSSKPEQTAAALAEAASYRRSVFPPTGAQRTAIQLADAFTDQQNSRRPSAVEPAWAAQNAVEKLHLAIVTANGARETQIEYGDPWPAQWPATLLGYAEDARALAELFEAAAKAAGA